MNLYVGNLPWSATEAELESHFTQAGAVKAVRIMTEGRSGRSKGFGFVEMGAVAEAEAAITALNETDLDGRQITVAEARERQRNGNHQRRSRSAGSGRGQSTIADTRRPRYFETSGR